MTEYVPLREAGLSIMPLPYGKKAPPPEGWDQYCIDRADDAQTDAWFANDLRNVAVACGPASGGVADGLVVLVFNNRNLYEAFNDGVPPVTWIAESLRGPHIYLRIQGDLPETKYWTSERTNSLEVLELRSTGAYVVAPDSKHPVGTLYRWAQRPSEIIVLQRRLFDLWLEARLERARANGWPLEARGQPRPANAVSDNGTAQPTEDDDDIGEGGRNVTLTRLAGAMRRQGADEETILAALRSINERRCKPPLGDDEVQRIAASVARYEPEPDGPTIHLTGHAAAASDDKWPEPAALDEIPSAPALPLDCLPSAMTVFARDVALRMQAPNEYVAFPMLVTASTVIGRGVGIRLKERDDWIERAGGIWVANIGDPSSMKTPAHHAGIRALRRLEKVANDEFESKLKAYREEVAAAKADKTPLPDGVVEPKQKLWVTDDYTSESLASMLQPNVSRGLAITRDELSGVIDSLNKYRHGQGDDRQVLLEAYNGLPKTINRVIAGYTFVPCLMVNIVGGIQESLARLVFGGAADRTDDGLATRFISIWPETGAWQYVDQYPNSTARSTWNDVIDVLAETRWTDDAVGLLPNTDLSDSPLPHAHFSNDAQAVFDAWYTRTMNSIRGPQAVYRGRLAGRVGKYPGLFGRLVLVLHLIEWAAKPIASRRSARVVGIDLVKRVVRLFDEYLLPMDRRVYAAWGASRDAELGGHIAAWIKREKARGKPVERMTGREARRAVRGYSDDEIEIARAVEWLCSQNWLREADVAVWKGRGRPGSGAFMVNPRLLT